MADVGKVVRISTDNKVEIVGIPWTYYEQKKLIKAENLKIVKTGYMLNLFVSYSRSGCCVAMFVDMFGALKDLPVNKIASWLYGAFDFEHGNFIHGDVLLFELSESGFDLPLSDPESVFSHLSECVYILESVGEVEYNEIPEVKSLRWLANMFPWSDDPKDEVDRMSNCIHFYASAGADKIVELAKCINIKNGEGFNCPLPHDDNAEERSL